MYFTLSDLYVEWCTLRSYKCRTVQGSLAIHWTGICSFLSFAPSSVYQVKWRSGGLLGLIEGLHFSSTTLPLPITELISWHATVGKLCLQLISLMWIYACSYWWWSFARLLQFLAVNVFCQLSWSVTLIQYCCIGCLDTAAKYGSSE